MARCVLLERAMHSRAIPVIAATALLAACGGSTETTAQAPGGQMAGSGGIDGGAGSGASGGVGGAAGLAGAGASSGTGGSSGTSGAGGTAGAAAAGGSAGTAGSAGAAGTGGGAGTAGGGGTGGTGGWGGAAGTAGAGASHCSGGSGGAGSTASKQTVTFQILNKSSAERLVATQGFSCTQYGIDSSSGGGYAPVALALAFQCLCECPNPGPPRVLTYRRLKPGESYAMKWDARRLTPCTMDYDCAQHGWPGGGIQKEWVAQFYPVASGAYRITVLFEATPPPGCTPSGDDYFCQPMPGPGYPQPGIAWTCPSTAEASVDFALPASGDVVVGIDIP
jgi:hypothetical protein